MTPVQKVVVAGLFLLLVYLNLSVYIRRDEELKRRGESDGRTQQQQRFVHRSDGDADADGEDGLLSIDEDELSRRWKRINREIRLIPKNWNTVPLAATVDLLKLYEQWTEEGYDRILPPEMDSLTMIVANKEDRISGAISEAGEWVSEEFLFLDYVVNVLHLFVHVLHEWS